MWYEKATWIEDDKTIKITVPLHEVLKKGTLRQILKESGLSMDEFLRLLNR
ncbi:MAG: YcfA-like protein [Candidatus Syntrophoarchaeum caldarius]|uniref:YcfA-like protein n=1 Tax=Candidatus Syntropharchaeum caldarium TaxID=1838285 RepID=A0A1F2P9W9_9EURY|nr:MAG: YcfA-like protein [Candidatus Syntrophoarchaeum caldarius]